MFGIRRLFSRKKDEPVEEQKVEGQKMTEQKKPKKEKLIVGCKLLREDGSSLNGGYERVFYPTGEWVEVPGNGAYIATKGGLVTGGYGPVLAYFECEEPVEVEDCPDGVQCFRRVRRLAELFPGRITSRLREETACLFDLDMDSEQRIELAKKLGDDFCESAAICVPDLDVDQRMELAFASEHSIRVAINAPCLSVQQRMALAQAHKLPGWLLPRRALAEAIFLVPGLDFEQQLRLLARFPKDVYSHLAIFAPNLNSEQRMRLVQISTQEGNNQVACFAPGLTAEQRMKLGTKASLWGRGRVARFAPDLSPEQRVELALESTTDWRKDVAHNIPDLTPEQRKMLENGKDA